MAKVLLIQDPACAQILRQAGFAFIRQFHNGKQYYAVPDTEPVRALLKEQSMKFNVARVVTSSTVHF